MGRVDPMGQGWVTSKRVTSNQALIPPALPAPINSSNLLICTKIMLYELLYLDQMYNVYRMAHATPLNHTSTF